MQVPSGETCVPTQLSLSLKFGLARIEVTKRLDVEFVLVSTIVRPELVVPCTCVPKVRLAGENDPCARNSEAQQTASARARQGPIHLNEGIVAEHVLFFMLLLSIDSGETRLCLSAGPCSSREKTQMRHMSINQNVG